MPFYDSEIRNRSRWNTQPDIDFLVFVVYNKGG